MKRLLPIILFALAVLPVSAQTGYRGLAPAQIGLDGQYLTEGELGLLSATYARTVPLDFFLPQVAGDSEMSVLGVSLGARQGSGDVAVAWAVRPLVLHLSKAPWTARFVLLHYDRAGLAETFADWIGLRIGPALTLARDRVQVRLPVGLSFSTLTVGHKFFDALSQRADQRAVGLSGSVGTLLRIQATNGVVLSASVRARAHLSGPKPLELSGTAQVEGSPTEALSWNVGFRSTEIQIGSATQRLGGPFLSFRFTPSLRGL